MPAMRILVVDDERAVRESLRRALTLEGYEVELAVRRRGGARAVRGAAPEPDAVVLDVLMPRLNGLEVCRRLRAAGNRMPVLMLTARDQVERPRRGPRRRRRRLPRQAVRARGAAGARARDAAPQRRPDAARRRCASPTSSSTRPRTRCARGGEPIELTRTEFSLLELFLRNPRQVLTRSVIFERVWGYDFGYASNSLDVYVGYLRRKTEAGGRPRLIQTIRGVGYALREP